MNNLQEVESNAYSLFIYAVRSQITRDYYHRRLRIFFDYIDLLKGKPIKKRSNTEILLKQLSYFVKCEIFQLQQNTEKEQRFEKKLIEKEKEFESLYQKTIINEDVTASLSDQLYNIMKELESLKEQVKFE